jgi:hypothetical protein
MSVVAVQSVRGAVASTLQPTLSLFPTHFFGPLTQHLWALKSTGTASLVVANEPNFTTSVEMICRGDTNALMCNTNIF